MKEPSSFTPHGETLAKIDKALQHVYDICQERARWRMSIPANPEYDSDLILCEALESARRALSASSERSAPTCPAVLVDQPPASLMLGVEPMNWCEKCSVYFGKDQACVAGYQRPSALSAIEGMTDENGRPMTYWGGKPSLDKNERLAQRFHEVYEELAPLYGWETQPKSRVAWADLPSEQRGLMIETVKTVLSAIEGKFKRFAAKCRPSVAHYMRTMERSAMSGALSSGAKEAAEKEAAWLGRLLDEIDEMCPSPPQDLGASSDGRTDKP